MMVFLSSCGALIDKTEVHETVLTNTDGEKIYIYDECNRLNYLKRDPLCYREFVKPQYCYHSLGKIVCYDAPLGGQEEVRRVK